MVCPITERECLRLSNESDESQGNLIGMCKDMPDELPDVTIYGCPAEATFVEFSELMAQELGED